MAYAFQPLEAALDSLGANYTDGVTVRIADKYTVKCDLNEVETVIQSLDPKVQSLHAEYDCAFEKQVLSDLDKYQQEKEKRDEERRKRIEEYDRRKAEEAERKREEAERIRKEEEEQALEDERLRLEEIEKEKERLAEEVRRQKEEDEEAERERKRLEEEKSRKEEEDEWKRFEMERLNSESSVEAQESINEDESADQVPVNCDTAKPLQTNLTSQNSFSFSTNESAANTSLANQNTANQFPPLPTNPVSSPPVIIDPSPSLNVISKPPTKPVKINFSDFEAEADVFADMELKTINELAELQTILAANQPTTNTQISHGGYMNGFFPSSTTIPSSSTVISNPYQSSQSYQGSTTSSSATVQQAYQNNPFGAPTPNCQSPSSGFTSVYPASQTGFATSTAQSGTSYSAAGPPQATQSRAGYPPAAASYQYPRPAYGNYYPGYQNHFPGVYPNTDRMYHPGSNSNQFGPPPQDPHQPANPQPPPQDPHAPSTRAHSNPPQESMKDEASLKPASRTRSEAGQQLRSEPGSHLRSKSSDRSAVGGGITGASEPEGDEGELKPSRSVGDILSELQKEASYLAEHKRKLIQTPPPRPASRGASGLEDWVPWPKLGPTEPMEGLSAEEKRMCSQLAEMGFPLSRLVTAVRSVGADSQKLISFCVLVDKYVEEGFAEDVSLDVVLLHASDETASRKHLSGYLKLAEFGFEKKDIHQALIDSDLDQMKALDTLIK